ncbi:alpha/beta-hydrolase [Aureobasidium pullulans]|uniref:Carboxypeptidase n=1 Tax=Aureobasidium pullulans TaxID=5580 RepID=A0A4T0BCT0_AURPU|nr:alpha/beta-hydrolase [Aureobasidium pullulans]
MHLLSLACTATCLLSLLPSSVLARSSKSAKYEKIQHERRIEMFAAQKEQQQDQRLQKRANHAYLTNNTAPFAVNGSGLPEVDFDIGESYAGSMPIGNSTTDSLFFWFVPTTNPLASDEIVIWLNGGPGCSSLDGFFHENGPVNWASGTYRPVRNTYSWSNLTNVIWIDQPISTGFSTGNATATNEDIVATQFLGFWRNFMDAFDLKGRKIYITGESYAGMYTPYIASAMLKHNDTSYYNVNGLMVYDPSIGYDGVISQAPALITQDKTVTLAAPLTTNRSLSQHTSPVPVHPAVAKPILNVNILRASPQIYIEASQYAFKNRVFKFSKQCTGCLTHLSLNDSLYLKTLNQHTLSRIEKLEIPISVDCSIEKPARSFRATKNSKSGMGIVLTTTAAMSSLTSLTVIVHFHKHYCWDVDQFKRLLDQLDLDELFTQVYRQIDSRVEVIWKAEIERSISVQFSEDEDGVAEQATEILRGMAGVFKVLHGMGGNARVGKGKKRRRVRV